MTLKPGIYSVNVKPTHKFDLGGDPNNGMVLRAFPTGKVRVLWANGEVRTHDVKSPYMARFDIKPVIIEEV